MTTSYTPTFGGSPVQPGQVSYVAYSFSSSFALLWPTGLQDTAAPAAFFVDLTPSTSGLAVSLPDATQVSVGVASIIENVGVSTVAINDFAGNTLTTLAPGVSKYFLISDNATSAGVWRVIQFGAGTSSADASALAGPGLQAISALLAWAPQGVQVGSSGSVSVGNRAQFIVWTGGVGTLDLPAVATAGDRFLAIFNNTGTGVLTLDPSGTETVDGAATLSLNPTESVLIEVVNGAWFSLGRGRTLTTSPVTTLSKNLGPLGAAYTLSAVEAAAQIQTYTDAPALGAPFSLFYGSTSNFYFVDNQVTGNTVTFKGAPADPGVLIPTGTKAIIINRGGTMSLAVSVTSGTVTSVATTARLTGGPITTTGTLDLAASGVTPGTYGSVTAFPQITIDTYGRATAAANLALSPIRLVGESVRWNGVDLPAGYLWEDGSAISRVTYALLFTALTSTTAATPTNLSATLTSVGKDYRNLGVEGAFIEGTNITPGTTVVSVTVNTIVMSAVATGSPGAVTIRLLPWGRGDGTTTFNVPDKRGRVGAARDNMGGAAAGRLTSGVTGGVGNGQRLNSSGGEQAHVQTNAELSAHGHGVNDPGHSHTVNVLFTPDAQLAGGAGFSINAFGLTSTSLTGISVAAAGGSAAANVVQPTVMENTIIFAGV